MLVDSRHRPGHSQASGSFIVRVLPRTNLWSATLGLFIMDGQHAAWGIFPWVSNASSGGTVGVVRDQLNSVAHNEASVLFQLCDISDQLLRQV